MCVWLHACVLHTSQPSNHEIKHIFAPALIMFFLYFFFIGLPLKPLSPLPPLPLITIIVWTSVEFRCETFALLWTIKHALSWPFVFSDFHSNSKQTQPWNSPPPGNALFSEKHIIQISSSGAYWIVVIFTLFWVSVVNIFTSLSGALALFKRFSKLPPTTESSLFHLP